MIHQLNIYGRDKVETAIMRLQTYEPPEGYYLCFSGGKDSVVIKALADMAGVKYDAHYSVSTVDPPELVRFIKDQYPDVEFRRAHDKNGNPVSMWSLIAKNTMPPTRIVRYCCAALKETGGKGRLKITGVRWDESSRRKKSHSEVTFADKSVKKIIENEMDDDEFAETPQGGTVLRLDNRENARIVEMCYKNHTTLINPIIDWTDAEVWEFIKEYNVPYCSLYDEGFKRLGCIGCPMASKQMREHEFERWPKYKKLYLLSIEKMIANRGGYERVSDCRGSMGRMDEGQLEGKAKTSRFIGMTPEDIFEWWID